MLSQETVAARWMLTAQEVADEYGIHLRTVRRLDADGRLPAYVMTGGRTKRYRREDVDRLFVLANEAVAR